MFVCFAFLGWFVAVFLFALLWAEMDKTDELKEQVFKATIDLENLESVRDQYEREFA